jgi:hypothetical protein
MEPPSEDQKELLALMISSERLGLLRLKRKDNGKHETILVMLHDKLGVFPVAKLYEDGEIANATDQYEQPDGFARATDPYDPMIEPLDVAQDLLDRVFNRKKGA